MRRHLAVQRRGFTLIELLVTVAIIAILASAVVFLINPAQILRQSRDARRATDISTLNKAVSLYYSDALSNPSTMFMGTSSVVYLSIPDPLATSTAGDQCQGLGLPPLPSSTYSYHCAASSTYMRVDGTGWLPINFNSYSAGSIISSLPVDPANATSTDLYYTYTTDGVGGYRLTAFFESQKEAPLMASDGGNDPELYEKGTNMALTSGRGLALYLPLDEGTGTVTADGSGAGNNGTLTYDGGGSLPVWSPGRVGPGSLYFNPPAQSDQEFVKVSPVNATATAGTVITVSFWADPNSSQVAGGWMVRNGTVTDENYGFNLNGPAGGYYSVEFTGYNGSFQGVQVTGNVVPANTWTFLTFVFVQGTSLTAYVNGASQGVTAYPYVNALPATQLDVGANNNATFQEYNGYLDDVRVYDRALSAAEIQEMYNATK
ncbi:MAG TPA: LamG-like jellyroll fold domain-containing protein [Candidatus Paceibacterota bacterium]|nr:LamG-like jellyroll fold domain-containing protein [Candidatus Paceibacterota bacterium]